MGVPFPTQEYQQLNDLWIVTVSWGNFQEKAAAAKKDLAYKSACALIVSKLDPNPTKKEVKTTAKENIKRYKFEVTSLNGEDFEFETINVVNNVRQRASCKRHNLPDAMLQVVAFFMGELPSSQMTKAKLI